jgi:riboflavin biosynthesis pyrimidine reductase
MSVDGYIDDTTPERLRLSDEEDFDRVDQVRAESDAILIGATTLRRDNPRLIVKSRQRQAERETRELPACPLKVVVTASVGASLDFGAMVDDLGERGVRQLMVEGGTSIHPVPHRRPGRRNPPRRRAVLRRRRGRATVRAARQIPAWQQPANVVTPVLPADEAGRSGELIAAER